MSEEKAPAAGEAGPTVNESCARIREDVLNLVMAFAPSEEVLAHFRAARIEVLKGLRAAIDARIERISQDRHKGRSVTIE